MGQPTQQPLLFQAEDVSVVDRGKAAVGDAVGTVDEQRALDQQAPQGRLQDRIGQRKVADR